MIQFKNNATSTLAIGIDGVATSITVSTGTGSKFPSLSASDWFYATLVDSNYNSEVVKCTAINGDVLTVIRGADSTTAKSFAAGSRIEQRWCTAAIADSSVQFASVSDVQAGTSTTKAISPATLKQGGGVGGTSVGATVYMSNLFGGNLSL